MGTRWRGLLAPIDEPTGDGRRMMSGGLTHRPLPLPLKWQRTDENGHDTSVVVGLMDRLQIDENAGEVWGEGELFDDVSPSTNPRLAEDVAEAKYLLEKQAIGPSIDPGSAQAMTVMKGSDDELTDTALEQYWMRHGEMPETELLFTNYEIAAATLVPVPAFAQCRPFELSPAAAGLTAAEVRSSGWSDMPIAPREHDWDGDAAAQRIASDCGIDTEDPDWDCYASAFLYQYADRNPETRGAYGFGIADHIDGQHQIVPAAVYAVASVLQGGRGGTEIPAKAQDRMKAVVSSIYKRMAKQFEDPSIIAPWDADKMALIAAAGLPPLDPSVFDDPQLPEITPLTREPLGNGWTRVFGHIATHDVCHVGIRDMCTTAPYSELDYRGFHRYERTDDGTIEFPLALGRLTAAHGAFSDICRCCRGNDDHACDQLSLGAAIAHHDRMDVLSYGRVGEDERNNAIWFSGVEAPDIDERGIALLNRQKVSGDWRPFAGGMELTEILVLSHRNPGFPLPRVAMRGGRQSALVAAGTIRVDHVKRQSLAMPAGPDFGMLDYERLGTEVARALVELAQPAITASVRTAGWDDLPLASDGHKWDVGAAKRRLADWAGDDISGEYARAFLWRVPDADPDLKGSYRLPIADVVDGRLTIVPDGVRASASRLPQTDGIGPDDEQRIRSILDRLFDRIHERAGTASITAAGAHAGAMAALRMTDEDAARLCVTDGLPMEEMHLTLAYLGKADEIPPEVREKIIAAGRKLAAKQPGALAADGFAIDAFNPGTANDRPTAIVMGVSGEELAQLQQTVASKLNRVDGYEMPQQHTPWVPHVTLQYTDDLGRIAAFADRVGPITFDRLRLAFAGDVVDIPLGEIIEIDERREADGMYTAALASRAALAQVVLMSATLANPR